MDIQNLEQILEVECSNFTELREQIKSRFQTQIQEDIRQVDDTYHRLTQKHQELEGFVQEEAQKYGGMIREDIDNALECYAVLSFSAMESWLKEAREKAKKAELDTQKFEEFGDSLTRAYHLRECVGSLKEAEECFEYQSWSPMESWLKEAGSESGMANINSEVVESLEISLKRAYHLRDSLQHTNTATECFEYRSLGAMESWLKEAGSESESAKVDSQIVEDFDVSITKAYHLRECVGSLKEAEECFEYQSWVAMDSWLKEAVHWASKADIDITDIAEKMNTDYVARERAQIGTYSG